MTRLNIYSKDEKRKYLQKVYRHMDGTDMGLFKAIAHEMGFEVTSTWDTDHECPHFKEIGA